MTHLSKRKLEKIHFERLVIEFIRSLERSFKQGKTKPVFFEFFTYTERAMFAKRLAVVAMLSKDIPPYVVSEVLNMSPSTVARMEIKYERGKYDGIIKYALGKKDIWAIVESILSAGGAMPPIAGGKRWKRMDKAIYDHNLLET